MHKILCLSMLIFLAGCNGDIFIDDYMPERLDEITISEANNSKEINFRSDNWSLISISCDTYDTYTTNAYTIDGELTYLPFDEKELGTVHYTSEYLDALIEKKSGKKLKITLNENLQDANVELLITVGNEFKYENIKMLMNPTQKYQIDSVLYDFNKFEIYEGRLNEVQSQIFHNNSVSPLTIGVLPYSKSSREVDFYDPTTIWKEGLFNKLLGSPLPEIIIPDIVDGKPVLLDTKVEFGNVTQHLETDLDKGLIVYVTIDGFDKRKVIVYNEFISYSVPYSVYMSNPRTGKKLTFSGELNSSEPIDYYVSKRKVDEN